MQAPRAVRGFFDDCCGVGQSSLASRSELSQPWQKQCFERLAGTATSRRLRLQGMPSQQELQVSNESRNSPRWRRQCLRTLTQNRHLPPTAPEPAPAQFASLAGRSGILQSLILMPALRMDSAHCTRGPHESTNADQTSSTTLPSVIRNRTASCIARCDERTEAGYPYQTIQKQRQKRLRSALSKPSDLPMQKMERDLSLMKSSC